MEKRSKKWIIPVAIVLAVILALCAWIYGWGGGPINVMDFSADEVERFEITCTDTRAGLHRSVITDKDDIQALIDSINAFRHTGNDIKHLPQAIGGLGGSVLYEFDVYLLNGETFPLCFASNSGEQARSDMEAAYWIYQPDNTSWFANTCRGSMETFYALYEKYNPTA